MNEKYPLALPEGSVLAGQYIIERVLGQGGFGITYEAKDHKTGERVAVKEFFPDSMATRTNHTTVSAFSGERGESFAYGKTCFLQEAETLAKFIGNENIVRIHSYFEENETAYFVMDFIEGTSFDEYLKDRGGRIPFEEAAQILVPVMDALSAVHSQGIVHRDVTPDNIYITKEGVVKLLDFGAARYSLGDKSRSLDIILKHGFAPKEQYTRRGKQGPYTDVYALGATFYFALTGKRPPDSVERMDEDDLVPPSSLGVQISDAAEDAILQALSVQPGDRFQSMLAFRNALYNSQQPAAVGSQPVSQIYFTAPDQTSIPRSGTIPHSGTIPRSGTVGSSVPGAGQDSDLQDLASTMKTAGLLAGRMAGKMAGKVAEKTAETAGVVAGTAGKMSEIMAAKKAETAEKLAAKMAEREAEKAAREAAAAENTVGRTVGVGYTGGMPSDVPPSTPPAKPPFNKKLLLIPAGVVAAVLIGVFALKLGSGSEPSANVTPTERPSASVTHTDPPVNVSLNIPPSEDVTPTEPPATQPPATHAGSFKLVGSYIGNTLNDGLLTVDSSGNLYWTDHEGHSLYSESAGEYLYENEEGVFTYLTYNAGKLYFCYYRQVYAYHEDTGELEKVAAVNDLYGGGILRLILTEDYYVVGVDDGNRVYVSCVSRNSGDYYDCCITEGYNTFTLSTDGWVYYTGRQEDKAAIFRTRLDGSGEPECLGINNYEYAAFSNPVVVGDYLYVCLYSTADNDEYSILRVDRNRGYQDGDPIWEIASELDATRDLKGRMGFNVNRLNHDIYFYFCDSTTSVSNLYEIEGHDDGTLDITRISQNSYCPNVVYNTDNSYQLNYYHYNADDGEYQLYYRDYDANGNYIKD